MPKKIYLIDGNSFIYRMFFALPEFSTKDGKIVNAVFGMAKFFVGQLVKEKPDYLFFIKDAKGENFRHKLYTDYKATRDRMPDNLRTQIADIEKMIDLMGIDIIEIPGYEADDVIGTLATKLGENKDYEIDILTGDKDLYALVTTNVRIYDTMKKKKFGIEETKEKFGIEPSMIVDYLAIMGDKSDNIPGIDGFGPKKAVDLINNLGGIEEIYEISDKIENGDKKVDDLEKSIQSCFKGKTFEKLIISRDNAFLSKKLATLDKSVSLGGDLSISGEENLDIEKYIFNTKNVSNNKVIDFFRENEFHSLLGEEKSKDLKTWSDQGLDVKIIGDKEGLDVLNSDIKKIEKVVLDTETTSLDIMKARLAGVSIYLNDKNIYYINRLHKGPQVSDTDLRNFLNTLFDIDILIVGHNLKYDLEIIQLYLKGYSDEEKPDNGESQMSLGI